MTKLFLKVVNMSISASWLILAVLICRLILKKAPKWVNVLLWGIVAVRLLFPLSVESALSLIPSAETITPEIMMDASPTVNTGIPAINNVVNPVISQTFAPSTTASASPLQIWIPVLAAAWVVGVVGALAYTAATYWRLRRKVETAVLLRDNIFQSENVGPHPYQLIASPRSAAFQHFGGLFVPGTQKQACFPLHCLHPLVSYCGSGCESGTTHPSARDRICPPSPGAQNHAPSRSL